MNEKSEWDKRRKLRKLYHVLAQLEFYMFLAGKSASQINYSVSKQMFAACRDRDEQLHIVKESSLLSEKTFLLTISHVLLHKDNLCYFGSSVDCNTNCVAELFAVVLPYAFLPYPTM